MENDPIDLFSVGAGYALTGEFNAIAKEIGNVTWAWNNLQADLCDLFWLASKIEDPHHSRAIWSAIKSDAGQRDILCALANSHLDKEPYGPHSFKKRQFYHGMRETVWLTNEVGALSAYRNDATHTLWGKDYPRINNTSDFASMPNKVVPDIVRGDPRRKRMVGKDARKLFNTVANYSIDLINYSRFVSNWILMWGEDTTFRERPIRPHL
jgi:hypothetical protein